LPPPDLRIVVDETCPWQIATELVARGYRSATSNYELGLVGKKDPPVLKALGKLADSIVLATYDNALPTDHPTDLKQSGISLAVIDKTNAPPDLTLEEYWREVIHRNAHRFVRHDAGSLWLYRRAGRRRLG
jgi:hypothetical protein